MKQTLLRIIDDFAQHPMPAGKAMRQLLESDRAAFCDAALPVLRSCPDSLGFQYLLTLLVMNGLILGALIDPSLFSLEEAVALARHLVRTEPRLDIRMIRGLLNARDGQGEQELNSTMASACGMRLLEIVAVISDGARILPIMAQLLQHPDPWVRSKAALLVGRTNKNHKWVEQRMMESDSRIRANAIESLWGVDSAGSRDVFWGALADSDNRVVGNALLGLYRLGEVSCISAITDQLNHPDRLFRISGIWVMGETGDQRFLSLLARLMSDPDADIRAAVFRSIGKLKQAQAQYPSVSCVKLGITRMNGSSAPWSQASVIAWQPDRAAGGNRQMTGLKPMQFVLYENSRLVTEYEVHENSHPEALAIAFAVPRDGNTTDPFHVGCERALLQALPHKRKNDAWLILKYLHGQPKEAAPLRPVYHSNRMLLIDEPEPRVAIEEVPLPPDVRFHQDPDAIAASAASPGSRLALPGSALAAVQTLIHAASQTLGSRHIVLISPSHGCEADSEACRELAHGARAAKAAIHVIALNGEQRLEDLAQRTGGSFTTVRNAEELPKAMETLCAGLINSYWIRYQSNDRPESGSILKLQIYSTAGLAEDVLALSAHDTPTAIVA